MRCPICSIQLNNPASIAKGIGPECEEKVAAFLAQCETGEQELGQLALASDKASKWIGHFRTEMVSAIRRRRGISAAMKCLSAARRAAGHAEASNQNLTGQAYFDYVESRAAGSFLTTIFLAGLTENL
ncbi:MAG TPA: DUF6011 domain-containing protein [Blastocatellia bacterium]|nr:DUF6011 domain-containing protein [Blastocatellia bacterium]HMV87203.1 DUF6011 domain-containing protein [Blastocatellia bacterium]HMX25557.1 DUF6011 domain-containing protein [Blastocatellia bacterium]HMY70291.1 DUF6011 domain-containing protein [Blastocatellia bacterium]HMZ18848.1 DUF6011 domain-containing protein [Blastocatellia bacterium]